MKLALIYLAFLATIALMIWIAARKAGRAEKELEYAKRKIKDNDTSGEILSRYINMSGDELDECVRERRQEYNKRMHSKD